MRRGNLLFLSILLLSFVVLMSHPESQHLYVSSFGDGSSEPNDPYFFGQWGLQKIQVLNAWDLEMGDPSVIIAVVDSGVDYLHPDLESVIWVNPDEDLNSNGIVDDTDFNGVDDDGNGFVDDLRGWDFWDNDNDPMDDEGHGTVVASVASAVINNGIDMVGVSKCTLMPVRFFGALSQYWTEIHTHSLAITYAVDNGAKVIIMAKGTVDDDAALQSFEYAHSKGVLIVWSAGNDNGDFYSWDDENGVWFNITAYENIMYIAGTDTHDRRANSVGGGSNYGDRIDVCAPYDSYVLWPKDVINPWSYAGGTSISAPFVGGLAGLIYSQNPNWTDVQVRERIKSTADPIDHLNPKYKGKLGSGRINAFRALGGEPTTDNINPSINTPSDITYVTGQTSNTITWLVSDDNPYWYDVTRNETLVTPGVLIEQWGIIVSLWNGSSITVNIDDLTPGTHIYVCTVYDFAENLANDTMKVTVTKIPTIISCSVSASEITNGDSITISGTIDPVLSDKTITLTYKKPENSTFTRTVTTDSDGSYSDSYQPDADGSWSVTASWDGDSINEAASSSSKSFMVKEKLEEPVSGCLIATATYGSELSPNVQFLREFRNNTVYNTFAGSSFMTGFNGFYYSFSPSVASVIEGNSLLRDITKVILYPLIGILHVSSTMFSIFSFIPELGIVIAGLVASSLIGVVYFLPIALILSSVKKFKVSAKIFRLMGLVWTGSVMVLIIAEISQFPPMMMVSTGAFVLVTIGIATLTSLRIVLKHLIH